MKNFYLITYTGGCAIKINGFSALGICRPTCGVREIGIQTKLRDTCTSYQFACSSPFELCCIPNQSEYGTCNLDLFKPNDILARVENSLNLPQNSLIKLSQLQPAFLESVINYRPVYTPGLSNKHSNFYNSNFKFNEIYDIARPSILHAKNTNVTKKEKPSDLRRAIDETDTLFDLSTRLSTQFRTVSNLPLRVNRNANRFNKVLRRVGNPTPNIRRIYHVHHDYN